ncbi:hypothetical protein J2S45_000251 [Trueperella abortisuis]|uniref:Uncharacterized protein n=1 Tax=Trueperella abortisuis TaxID=445930 RepID=A0ABT9PGG9_9ACTO|nr:hypothetical protein [Trueperella abortisuis]
MEDQTRKTLRASAPTWAILTIGTYAIGINLVTATLWALSILATAYGITRRKTR